MVTDPAAAPARRWPLVGRAHHLEVCVGAVADDRFCALLVHGPAGVGKTRLAEEVLAELAADGRTSLRTMATPTSAGIPFGALVPLLPTLFAGVTATGGPEQAMDPASLLDAARVTFDEQRSGLDGDDPLVLFVDDVHLLDPSSMLLLAQLATAGTVFLIGTVRTGERAPEGLDALERTDRVVRVDLGALTRSEMEELVDEVLGGPLERGSADDLWQATQGNALYLRELLTGATASGALAVVDGGVWRLTAPLQGTGRLVELIESRLAVVGVAGREVLEVLALCEPVGLAEAEELAPVAELERLEAEGLVVVRREQRRHDVVLAHPLYGEVLRSTLGELRRRSILRAHADWVEARGARRREDALRVASWRLDAGGGADADLLLRGARVARAGHDYVQVERLARGSFLERPTFAAGLLLGEALHELGSFAEAEDVLAACVPLVGDERDAMLLASEQVKNRFWGLLDPDSARATAAAAADAATSATSRNELRALEASVQMFSGAPVDALATLDGFEADDDVRTRVGRAIVEEVALAVTGRCGEAVAVAEAGFADHLSLTQPIAIAHPGTHVVAQVFALAEAGRLAEAVTLAEAGYQVAVTDRVPIAQIWFALNRGRALLHRGVAAEARRWFAEAASVAEATGYQGPRRMALTGLAVCEACLGSVEESARLVVEIESLPGRFDFLPEEPALARAWSAVAAGDPETARTLLLGAAVSARTSGHRVSEAWFLHDVGRLGGAGEALPGGEGVADRLEGLAACCDSELVEARAVHVRGLAEDDPELLAEAVERFAALDVALAAAEAAIAAAEACRRRGEQRAAAAHDRRADELARRCPGVRTPGLARAETVVPLTRREREIAQLAARGLASKVIAERLHLSVRTVDNHLQNAYTKLGVGRRSELADVLARS